MSSSVYWAAYLSSASSSANWAALLTSASSFLAFLVAFFVFFPPASSLAYRASYTFSSALKALGFGVSSAYGFGIVAFFFAFERSFLLRLSISFFSDKVMLLPITILSLVLSASTYYYYLSSFSISRR